MMMDENKQLRHPSASGTRRTRVLRLDGFEPAEVLGADQREAFARRMVTLFDDGDAIRDGGFGSITRVHNIWGEVFALKTLSVDAGSREVPDATLASFDREYRVHRSVSGLKGFPRVYGRGTVDGAACILMEWVEGVTLGKAARLLAVDDDSRVSPLVAARIGRDLFEILSRMASLEDVVVHGDLSCANVMVRTDRLALADQADEGVFDLCIVDFGSVFAGGSLDSHALLAESAPASWRVASATREYAAPEAIRPGEFGSPLTAAADVYAAASLVFLLASGKFPFGTCESEGIEALLAKKRQGRPVPFRTAHTAADIGAVLSFEPEVAVGASLVVGAASLGRRSDEVRSALLQVDCQLDGLLESCFSVDPGCRPSAKSMCDALGCFAFHYVENIACAINGRPLIPCVPGSLSDGFGQQTRDRAQEARIAVKAVCCVLTALVAILSGAGLGLVPHAFSVGSPVRPGISAGALGGALCLVPFAVSLGASLLGRRGAARFGYACAGAAVGVLAAAAALAALGTAGEDARMMTAGALGASALLGALFSLIDAFLSATGFANFARSRVRGHKGAAVLPGYGVRQVRSADDSTAATRLEGDDAK